MRYTYYFEDEITPESIQELIDIISQFESVDLFFATNGGQLTCMNTLLHAINQHPDINIYLTNMIASAGTFLLFKCDKPVYITDDLDAIMFHLADRPLPGSFRKQDIDVSELHKQLDEFNQDMMKDLKRIGLTTAEVKRVLKGEDVYLYKKDFKRLKTCKMLK